MEEIGEDMVVVGWVGEVGEKVVADWVGDRKSVV